MKKIKQFLCGSSSIYQTVKPFYYFLKLFGLASFQLNCKERKIRMTFKDYLILLCSISVGMFIVYTTCSDVGSYIREGQTMIENGWKYQYLYQIVITVPMIVYGFIKRKHVQRFLEIIYFFDEQTELSNWEHKINHSQDKVKILIWLLIGVILIIIMYFFALFTGSYLSYSIPYQNLLLNSFVIKLHDLVMYQFIFSVLCIKRRYDLLNKNMSLYFSLAKYRSKWSRRLLEDHISFIKKITHLHDLLFDSLTEVNSIYSLQVTPVFSSTNEQLMT